MKYRKFLKWSLLFFWMILIFLFSHQNGVESSETSSRFFAFLLSIFPFLHGWEWMIRKLAHFFLYFVLGILSFEAGEESLSKPYSFSWLFCFLYACSDEFHQFFMMGRSGNFFDVFLDTLAASFSLLVVLGIQKFKKRKICR